MREYSLNVRSRGTATGLVPTMGALHDGHLSLLKAAVGRGVNTVMSIFVNPTQFGPAEDFEKYPRRFIKDCELAEMAGCDCVFVPSAGEIYPENYRTYVDVEELAGGLCGASRPIHFRGVATVVLKLFNIVMPHIAVFGAKDAQQVIVVKRMVEDLNLPVQIIAAPTVREPDGLAMSSRNAYLSPQERAEAPLIHRALAEAQILYDAGERSGQIIRDRVRSVLDGGRLIDTEYAELVDTTLLKPLVSLDRVALAAVACRTSETGTRLIDNIVLGGNL
jgi:pantoate--beta-alanine ligase